MGGYFANTCRLCYNSSMTHRDLFNDPIGVLLDWFRSEQAAGRMYSRRGLLRMAIQERERVGCPRFSRNGLVESLNTLTREGRVSVVGSVHKKIMVNGTPLPPGSSSFL